MFLQQLNPFSLAFPPLFISFCLQFPVNMPKPLGQDQMHFVYLETVSIRPLVTSVSLLLSYPLQSLYYPLDSLYKALPNEILTEVPLLNVFLHI